MTVRKVDTDLIWAAAYGYYYAYSHDVQDAIASANSAVTEYNTARSKTKQTFFDWLVEWGINRT